MVSENFVHLRQSGVSLLIDLSQGPAEIIHWGLDLGPISAIEDFTRSAMEPVAHAELDVPMYNGIWRENSRGNIGVPALQGHRSGSDWSLN